MTTCEMCAKRNATKGSTTCGESYCQEASYWHSVARRARKGSVARREAEAKARKAEVAASRWR